jgi:hypothetical protein
MNYIEKEFNAATENELKFRGRKSESDARPNPADELEPNRPRPPGLAV